MTKEEFIIFCEELQNKYIKWYSMTSDEIKKSHFKEFAYRKLALDYIKREDVSVDKVNEITDYADEPIEALCKILEEKDIIKHYVNAYIVALAMRNDKVKKGI